MNVLIFSLVYILYFIGSISYIIKKVIFKKLGKEVKFKNISVMK